MFIHSGSCRCHHHHHPPQTLVSVLYVPPVIVSGEGEEMEKMVSFPLLQAEWKWMCGQVN